MHAFTTAAAAMLLGTAGAAGAQGQDEANRQRAMNTQREQAARADRSAFQASLDRQQSLANAARAPASSRQPVGTAPSRGANYAGSGATGAATPTRQSVVATRTVTMGAADAPQLVIARLEAQAAAGDTEAAFDLGRIFNADYPFPHDHAKARAMFALAAKAGHAGAQGSYGHMLDQGMGGPADPAAALNWLKRSADAGNSFGQLTYGMKLAARFNDAGYDGAPAVRYLSAAAAAGEMAASAMLGTIFLYGMGVPADDAAAARYLKMASDLGEHESTSLLGSLYASGRGGGTREQGYALIGQASDAGVVISQRIYGQMLLNGIGVATDAAAGAALIRRAADTGDADAMALVGSMFEDGQGVARDHAAALKWWGLAAQNGHAGAKAQLDTLPAADRAAALAARR